MLALAAIFASPLLMLTTPPSLAKNPDFTAKSPGLRRPEDWASYFASPSPVKPDHARAMAGQHITNHTLFPRPLIQQVWFLPSVTAMYSLVDHRRSTVLVPTMI
ncbi:hypothetical protein FIBSPDRAFT_594596 [Athelia psychrophila]|uniref:Uncharacterized protein n=1 Tax=Athelia psychrophila TaxID=1759441 RepID=A0A166H0P9_9AGAM|nr:hypothetical protein FIBSPDRAFT_594596 [Fibularhizoctonia sp. CBS 109695]